MASPQWFIVPAGTEVVPCRSPRCQKPIYWIEHPRTKRPHPIDCEVPGGKPPTINGDKEQVGLFDNGQPGTDGRGISHFETCVDAASFRGRR